METTKVKIWDNYVEIGEVRKSDGIKFVIAAATRNGYRYINIREFYFRKKLGVWKPGRDGITIPLKAPLNSGERFIAPFDNMYNILKIAAEKAEKLDLLDDSKAVWGEKKMRFNSNESDKE